MRLLCLCCLFTLHSVAQPPVGQWREHLPYGSVIDITPGNNKIYAATPYSLFSVSFANNSIERFSRITGLSETGISAIEYDAGQEKLLIAYSNSNLDIIYRNDVINIPAIKQSATGGDKSIYNIFSLRNNYYLATGIGIIVVDGDRYEVKDSWFIGNNGSRIRINNIATDETNFYAATVEGLKFIAINNPTPSDYRQWATVPRFATSNIANVMRISNTLIVQREDSLFAFRNNSWEKIYTSDRPIVKTNSSNGLIYISQRTVSGQAQVTAINSNGLVGRVYTQPGVISLPLKALAINDAVWIADQFGGLSKFTSTGFGQYKPNSPEATASGEMVAKNNIFYATAGEVNDAWNYLYNGNGIYKFENGQWTNINRYRYPELDSLLDYVTIAIDPDQSVWAGSYGGGLLHIIAPGSFRIFKQNIIGPTLGDPTSYRVSGLAFDQDQILWVSNFGASQPLIAKKKDGSWKKFTLPFAINENPLTRIIVDDFNYKWIVASKGNGLICFDDNHSPDNTNDDRWKRFTSGAGHLPDENVLTVAKDKSGFIWVGTSNGIGVLQCVNDVFTNNCEATWPIVQLGNFAGYLFSGQEVRDIAVDGANRKWIATSNGVFLISATGQQVIYQFNESNSPLLSNDVKKITIDGSSGEIYFATLKGICSFRGTATEAAEAGSNVIVFPNPVPPSYNGTIVIKNLPENSIVKITEPDGRLVYQTKALGAQAVWDGRDYKGRKISTGVYLVMAITDPSSGTGREKAVSKIVFIGR